MFHALTIDAIQRKIAAGGTVPRSHRRAIDKLIRVLVDNSLTSKIKRLNLFSGGELTAALVPEIVGGGNAADTNHNFVSGDYTPTGGIVGNGSSKYLDTGWVPSAELTTSLDAHGAGIVLAKASSSGFPTIFGSASASFTKAFVTYWNSGNSNEDCTISDFAHGCNYPSAAPAEGHICISCTASGSGGSYLDAVLKQNGGAMTTNVRSTASVHIFSQNNDGSPGSYHNGAIGGYHFGLGLTSGEITTIYNAIAAFCTAIGRTLP